MLREVGDHPVDQSALGLVCRGAAPLELFEQFLNFPVLSLEDGDGVFGLNLAGGAGVTGPPPGAARGGAWCGAPRSGRYVGLRRGHGLLLMVGSIAPRFLTL